MDDLNAMINQIMSNPDSMRQIQEVASSLGLGGNQAPQAPQPAPPPPQNQGFDLSSLAALLGGSAQPQNTAPPPASQPDLSALAGILSGAMSQPQTPAPQNTGVDMSALSSLLSGLKSGQQNPPNPSPLSGLLGGLTGNQQSGGTPDLSALTALLGNGAAPAPQAAPGLPNIDLGTIMKLTQALSSRQANRANVDLLLALKPRLNDERSKKVDDAIRVMQLIQFLPLIKESGLFGEMDSILGGLGKMVGGGSGGLGKLVGGGSGGLGGLLGNVGNGIGGLLGGLGRR